MFKRNMKRVIAVVMAASIIMQQGTVSKAMESEPEEVVSTVIDTNPDTTQDSDRTEDDSSKEPGNPTDPVEPGASDEAGTGSSDSQKTDDATGDASTGDSSTSDPSSDEATDESSEEATDEASEDATIDEELSEDEASEGETTEDKTADAEKELPEGVNGLPEGYELSDTQEELKSDALSSDSLEGIDQLNEGEDYVKNQVVTMADSLEEAEAIAYAYSGTLTSFTYGVAVIDLSDSDLTVSEAVNYSLVDTYDLPYVEPNYITVTDDPVIEADSLDSASLFATAKAVPTNNAFADRWWIDKICDPYLNPENANYQWHHDYINTYSAWGVTTGSNKITVAVIDTGVNTGNTDLKTAKNSATITAENMAKKVNSKITEDASDKIGHGTHVSGIIAGRLNNSLGAGIAPGVNILSLKISNGQDLENAAIMAAINNVAGYNENGTKTGGRRADIINLSLGQGMGGVLYQKAIDNAYAAGVTVVAAMGNDNGSNQKNYPAACDHVIAVTSVNQDGSLSGFSSYGPWADIAAPGAEIYSTAYNNNSGYIYMSGTSMASPVVAGACALYMSAVGHVDPDTMERVLKSSVTGSAGGAGILDLSKLFKGDTTAPRISLKANNTDKTILGEAQDGKTFTVPCDVASDSVVSFTALNFGGSTDGNAKTNIVYTTDGTSPAVVNGEVISGTVISPSETVSVNKITGTITQKTKVTVKAASLTGMGVMGKVSTLVFTVDPSMATKSSALTDKITVKITNVPVSIVSGKSFKLEALVTSNDTTKTVSQKVTWKIESYSGADLSKCKINATNGTLTTVAGKTGSLLVSCTTADSRARTTATIKLTNIYPVSAMTIASTKAGLGFNYSSKPAVGETATVYVKSMTDTAKNDLLKNTTYSYKNKTLQWVSSNPAVVTVGTAATYNGAPAVSIKAVSAGTATITCKALDGSGKSAKITVKVTPDQAKKVTSIALYDGKTKPANGQPASAKTVTAGSAAFSIYAEQTCADKGTNYITPVFTTSNSNIVRLTASGNVATLTPVAKGTATITCTAADGSGKKATYKVTVLQQVTSITVSGQKYIAKGTSAKYTAAILPATANNKKVTFEFADPSALSNLTKTKTYNGITINKDNGTVKVAADANVTGKIYVRAIATDGSKKYGTYAFEICDKAAKVTAAVKEGSPTTIATVKKGTYTNTTRIMAAALNSEGKDLGTEIAFKSSNENVAKVSREGNTNVVIVTAVGKGTATITATAQDGSKKSASVKITVLQLVDEVNVTGQSNVAVGTNATFKAAILPAGANNKNVTWSVVDASTGKAVEGVSINSKGTVSVAATVPAGKKLVVKAIPADTNAAPAKYTWAQFSTTALKTSAITITAATANQNINIPVSKNGTLSTVRLYDTNIADSKSLYENKVTLEWKVAGSNKEGTKDLTKAVGVVFTSSNPKVATVSQDNNTQKVTVTALMAGTTTITAAAQDGSGKKTSVKVTVITPVSGVELVGASNISRGSDIVDYVVAKGVSTTVKATVGSAYGKPSVSKVTWDYEIGLITDKGFATTISGVALSDICKKNKYFFTFSNGQLKVQNAATIKKNAEKIGLTADATKALAVKVTATATDGTGSSASRIFWANDATTYVKTYYKEGYLYRYYKAYAMPSSFIDNAVALKIGSNLDGYKKDAVQQFYSVTSSNPKVATAAAEYKDIYGDGNKNFLLIYPHGKGTTKITITALDGTNKKETITIKVQ